MERTAWTDERLDDLAESVRSGFARVDQDIRDLRTEMHEEFRAVNALIIRVAGGMLLGFISVLAAILARGA
jgi:hypothetical protein